MGRQTNFHSGERQLQEEDGIDAEAYESVMTQPFSPQLNPVEVRFVNGRTFGVAASIDADGRPWSTPLFGAAGQLFAVENDTTVRVRPGLPGDHPLLSDIADNGQMGVLYFDPSLRRRAKSLGSGTVEDDGSITYRMSRNFGVCNRYIFKRTHEAPEQSGTDVTGATPSAVDALSADNITQLRAADTTFIASRHAERGVETTHRGGPAGFVTVEDAKTITLPDYPGNGMFNTLGNVLLDDRIGFMTVDFSTGRVLQITGRGQVTPSAEDDPMSTRTLRISIDEVRSSRHDIGTWTDVEEFPIQPGMYNPGTPYLPGREPASRRS